MTDELTRAAQKKEHAAKDLQGAALENQIRKNRMRWLRQTLTDAGTKRAKELGWPNTYTLYEKPGRIADPELSWTNIQRAAIAVVRPAIVESSVEQPFRGWNEGINTSASLSYLLGTFFRQLPSTETKCLDLIPVDLVSRGMTLIAAALVTRRNARVYHLATSVANPCDMARSIELTGLAHRKYYRAQKGLEHTVRLKFDAISVSKTRYQAFSAPAQQAIVKMINRTAEPFASRPPLARQERDLEKVIKLIALFEPFILHNDHVFEAANVECLSAMLPEDERAAFELRHAIDRLVGLLDQRARSGAAQVVLSSHRRTADAAARKALRGAGSAVRRKRRACGGRGHGEIVLNSKHTWPSS